MDGYEVVNMEKLRNVIGEVNLTKSEEKTLVWLSGWESDVVDDIVSIITKARSTEPLKPVTIKRMVWPVVAFFKEDADYGDVSETRYAFTYGEIGEIKKQFMEDYEDDIAHIVADDEPVLEEFYA